MGTDKAQRLITSLILLLSLMGCRPQSATQKPSLAKVPTRFTVQDDRGTQWLRTPNGSRFFSFGLCGINQGTPPASYQVDNPSYSAPRYYPTDTDWAVDTLNRLTDWKITNIGPWSDWYLLKHAPNLNQTVTPVLHLGASVGFPWEDMWEPQRLAKLAQNSKELTKLYRDNAQVIGYYTDNEIGWWNAALVKHTLNHSPTSGQRQRLIGLLRSAYNTNWSQLKQDFIPVEANSFSDLDRGGSLALRPGGNGIQIYRQFLALIADRYYQLVGSTLRQADPDALILGDRYPSFYYPEVARAATRWVDAISLNLNSAWNDGTQLRCITDSLFELTGKPILISEVSLAATEIHSDNPNSAEEFPEIVTQTERAQAAATMLSQLAAHPKLVGIDLFQFYDVPAGEGLDGGIFNTGLVDIDNQPYAPLTEMIQSFDLNAIHSIGNRGLPSVTIPLAALDPIDLPSPGNLMLTWDRYRSFIPAMSAAPQGDLYVCWNPDALYVACYAVNLEESDYYLDGRIPISDRMRLTLSFPDSRLTIDTQLGNEPNVNSLQLGRPVDIPFYVLPFPTRTIFVVGIPSVLLGHAQLQVGQRYQFTAELRGHANLPAGRWEHHLFIGK